MKSMTGYGLAQFSSQTEHIQCEIKTLNSKGMDINFYSGKPLGEAELEFRKILEQRLIRGRTDLFLQIHTENDSPLKINSAVLKEYYRQLENIALELNTRNEGILASLLRLEGVTEKKRETLPSSLIAKCKDVLEQAIEQVNSYREKEGKVIQQCLAELLHSVRSDFEKIVSLEPQRTQSLKEKWKKQLLEIQGTVPPERIEQEILFFAERMDIREETDRFLLHLNHFEELLYNGECVGKKLVFLCQELHREINTLSNKSSHAEIQRYAVNIKEYLEKIREQCMNVL